MSGPDDGRPRHVRVASYNVHACIGTDGVFSPPRIAEVLAGLDADFVALQEVEEREYQGMTVSEFLMNALGLVCAGRTTHRRAGFDYGNVVLSRVSPLRTVSLDLGFPRREPRGAIEADFAIDGYAMRLLATHFGLSKKERRAQLRTILPYVENREPDLTVLCADFNEWLAFSHVHRTLRRVLGTVPAVRTFPSRFATLSLDRIYASPLATLVSVMAVATGAARRASDHLPVIAEFDLTRIDTRGSRPGGR
jgi:endonuclease/exonuclease/phosphatase family metal-dependent hydrolase